MAYSRLMEKARHRDQAVKRASGQVTDRVTVRQDELRKSLLDQINSSSMEEKDVLREWRRIIHSNTHPRYMSGQL